MLKIFLALLIPIAFIHCSTKNEKNSANAGAAIQSVIPDKRIRFLLDSCTAIDYLYYEPTRNFSISSNSLIDQHINFISRDAARIDSNCVPTAHVMFRVKELIPIEADLFFTDKCQYWVITDQKKYRYVQKINPSGIEFLKEIQAKKMKVKKSVIR